MDEHYIMNVLKALGQKIDTLEYMNEEYQRIIAGLEEKNAYLCKRISELEEQHG